MKMSGTVCVLVLCVCLIHTANAFNVTKILESYPDYSTFNSYLTETNLASEINSRRTITVLAVDNGNMSPLSGKPLPLLKNILSVHVVLDYYDLTKLHQLSKTSVLLTTLFQSTGLAQNHQGFINVTHLGSDSIAMGSAAPGSPLGTNLIKSVASQPYNISILQVSNVIVPPGIDASATPRTHSPTSSPPAPPTHAPKSSKAPSPSRARPPKKSATPTPAPEDDADSPVADVPASDNAPPADSGAGALHVGGLAVVITMVLSNLYLASRI